MVTPSRALAPPKRARRPNVWIGPIGITVITLLLILGRQGRVLELAFPVMATIVGVMLYRRSKPHFAGYVLWIWFLSPEVRRFADFYKGFFNPVSPVQIAPLLVTTLCMWTIVRRHRQLGTRTGVPIIMVGLGLLYAYGVGVLTSGAFSATFDLTNWLLPVVFAFHILESRVPMVEYVRVIRRTLVSATFLIGGYGIIQFVVVPPWDGFWLIASELTTQGDPVPFGMRAFGTLGSSAPMALVMSCGLMFLLGNASRLRLPAAAAGIVALAVTGVRAAWGGVIVALIYQVVLADMRRRTRIIIAAIVIIGLGVGILSMTSFGDKILSRVTSVNNLHSDNSFDARAAFYKSFITTSLTNVQGTGFGATGLATRLNSAAQVQSFDSGLMNVPYVLGWPGTLLYLGGIGLLAARSLRAARVLRRDAFVVSAGSIWIALLAQMVFTNTLTSLSGLFFFMMMVFPLLALREANVARRARMQASSVAGR